MKEIVAPSLQILGVGAETLVSHFDMKGGLFFHKYIALLSFLFQSISVGTFIFILLVILPVKPISFNSCKLVVRILIVACF